MQQPLHELHARQGIRDTLSDYAAGIDLRDWPRYRACFTDEVDVDFETFEFEIEFQAGSEVALVFDDKQADFLTSSPHFSPSPCCGTVSRALDCVRADDPILNVQEARLRSDRRLFLARPRPTAPRDAVW